MSANCTISKRTTYTVDWYIGILIRTDQKEIFRLEQQWRSNGSKSGVAKNLFGKFQYFSTIHFTRQYIQDYENICFFFA